MALSVDEIHALQEEVQKLRSDNEALRSDNWALKCLNKQLHNEIQNLQSPAPSATASPQPMTTQDKADALLLPGRICTFEEALEYSPYLPEDKKVYVNLFKGTFFIDNGTFSTLEKVAIERMVAELVCEDEPLYADFISDSGICDSCDFRFV
ncbi:hypothetical protein ACHAPJ_012945 [Fusarium lateritium]